MEPRFHLRLQDHLDVSAPRGRRSSECRAVGSALSLVSRRAARRRMIRARRHPIQTLYRFPQVPLERRQGHTIHPQHRVSPSPAGKLPRRVASECHKASPQTRLLPSRVGQHLRPSVRSLRSPRIARLHRYYGPVRPAPRIGIGASQVFVGDLPWHRGDRSPRSAQEPLTGPRRLHAGRRSASRQAPSELRFRPTTGTWFRRRPNAFDTSSTVHSRSSYQRPPDGLSLPLPQRSPPRPLCRRGLRRFEP